MFLLPFVDVHPFNGGCLRILRIVQQKSEQHSSEHAGSCHLLRDLVQALEPGNSPIPKPDLLLKIVCGCSMCCTIELNP